MVEKDKKWEIYQQVAVYLLDQVASVLGLETVEGEQPIIGKLSGTTWTVDGKGVKLGNEGFVILEVRRYTSSRLKQKDVAEVAYRIIDTEAAGGIIVSPLGFQEGAAKVAAAGNIVEVHMDENSTTSEYFFRFLNNVFLGVTDVAAAVDGLEVIKVVEEDRLPGGLNPGCRYLTRQETAEIIERNRIPARAPSTGTCCSGTIWPSAPRPGQRKRGWPRSAIST